MPITDGILSVLEIWAYCPEQLTAVVQVSCLSIPRNTAGVFALKGFSLQISSD